MSTGTATRYKWTRNADGMYSIPGVEVFAPHDYFGREKYDAKRVRAILAETVKYGARGAAHWGHNNYADSQAQGIQIGTFTNFRLVGETIVADLIELEPEMALEIAQGRVRGRSVELNAVPDADPKDGREFIMSVALLGSERQYFSDFPELMIEADESALATMRADMNGRTPIRKRTTKAYRLRAADMPMDDKGGEPQPDKPAENNAAALSGEELAEVREIIKAWKQQKTGGGEMRSLLNPEGRNVADDKKTETPADIEIRSLREKNAELERRFSASETERENERIGAMFAAKRSLGIHITAEEEADIKEDALRREKGAKRDGFLTRSLGRFTDDSATRSAAAGAADGAEPTDDAVAKRVNEYAAQHADDRELVKHIRSLGREFRANPTGKDAKYLIEAGIDQFKRERRIR